MFEINAADYEVERELFEMWHWIDSTARRIRSRDDCETIWFERREPNVKQFFEEAIPIALFALHMHRPGLLIRISCKLGNQPFDAVVRTENPSRKQEFKVEATVVEDRESAWRREALSKDGFCPTWGPIKKENGKIIAGIEMQDMSELWGDRISLAFDRAKDKVQKAPPYESGTAIVVYSEELSPPEAWWRAELSRRTHHLLRQSNSNVKGVYYIYSDDRSVISVANRPSTEIHEPALRLD